MASTSPSTQLHEEEHIAGLNTFGMWVFLAGEVLFFGAVIAAYMVYRSIYAEAFAEASQHLNVLIGGINTAILLTSSFTIALAVNAAQVGRRRALTAFLLITVLLGVAFLGFKAVEYYNEFQENLFPGGIFIFPGPNAAQASLFFSLYFTLTGLHAVHMILGMIAILVLAFLSWRNRFSPENHAPVEMVALFWHFVDIVWIFIFPLLYLIHPR